METFSKISALRGNTLCYLFEKYLIQSCLRKDLLFNLSNILILIRKNLHCVADVVKTSIWEKFKLKDISKFKLVNSSRDKILSGLDKSIFSGQTPTFPSQFSLDIAMQCDPWSPLILLYYLKLDGASAEKLFKIESME